MTTIIVLFNLKSGVSRSAYEAWAKETDLKTVRALNSIDRFDVFESMGLLGSDAKPPYEFIEVLEVNDISEHFRHPIIWARTFPRPFVGL